MKMKKNKNLKEAGTYVPASLPVQLLILKVLLKLSLIDRKGTSNNLDVHRSV